MDHKRWLTVSLVLALSTAALTPAALAQVQIDETNPEQFIAIVLRETYTLEDLRPLVPDVLKGGPDQILEKPHAFQTERERDAIAKGRIRRMPVVPMPASSAFGISSLNSRYLLIRATQLNRVPEALRRPYKLRYVVAASDTQFVEIPDPFATRPEPTILCTDNTAAAVDVANPTQQLILTVGPLAHIEDIDWRPTIAAIPGEGQVSEIPAFIMERILEQNRRVEFMEWPMYLPLRDEYGALTVANEKGEYILAHASQVPRLRRPEGLVPQAYIVRENCLAPAALP